MKDTPAEIPLEEQPPRTAHEIAGAYEAAIDGVQEADPSTDTGSEMPSNAPASGAEVVQTHASPPPQAENKLRLRVKVWTDPKTHKRYLMPAAFFRDTKNGRPITDVMHAYAMSDEDTKIIQLRAIEWNSLPFFYFQEDGWAPRATERPIDKVP